jgi:Fe-S-cluster containining protein
MGAGRRCGSCTLCCDLLAVPEIAKPALQMCRHCVAGEGCRIYESRPKQCRMFTCHFLENPKLSEEWRPSKSHFVLVVSPDGQRLAVNVDPARPGAWRRKPYYAQLKDWSWAAAAHPRRIGQVLVSVGKQTFVILPDRDVDVGAVEEDEIVVTEGLPGAGGMTFNAFKMKKDDPRAGPILRATTGAGSAIF